MCIPIGKNFNQFVHNLFSLQYAELNNPMPIVNEAINYEPTMLPAICNQDVDQVAASSNNLAAFNNLNLPFNENVLLLIQALNTMKVDAQNPNVLLQQQQQQHTCGVNSFIDCSASTIGTHSAGCTKKYQKNPVPPDYMCHLCFSKDHFIRDCPQVNVFSFLLDEYSKYVKI